MLSAKQILKCQIVELNQATSDHMGQIQAIFKAIGKVAAGDPVLAANLAEVGTYLAELATGDFDTIGMEFERVGEEIH
jgi:hypothetical protein